uniref:Uncharacterized protein n=1 Tax=viral metagenome TaxID=1070528 RepID=A0A6M3J656_9ZZZZ
MGSAKSYENLTSITTATALSATVYNPPAVFPESLANGTLDSGTSWTETGDFSLTSDTAVYTDSTHVGTLDQAVTALSRTGRSGATYEFTYTTSTASLVGSATITTAFAASAVSLGGLGTAGTYKVRFVAASIPGAFSISVASSSGAVTLDALSLIELVESQDIMQVKRAVITVETAGINFCVDGTTPTVTSGTYQGHLLNVGDALTLNDIAEIRKFRCINAVASNGAVVKVTYSFA